MKHVIEPSVDAAKTNRDFRFDFLRGFALLLIYSDHIRGNPWSQWSPLVFGLSDMAEVFVFVSGCVSGIAYSLRLEREGLWQTQKQAVKRVLQLLLAWGGGLLLLVAVKSLLGHPEASIEVGRFDLRGLGHRGSEMVLRVPVSVLNILLLYATWILPLPLLLWGTQPARWSLLALSGVVYLATQWAPWGTALPEPWQRVCYFHPAAWQLLFYMGVWMVRTPIVSRELGSQRAGWCGLAILLGLFAWSVCQFPHALPWTLKSTLQPLRLMHFLSLVFIVARVLPVNPGPRLGKWMAPIVLCGRHSLLLFVLGVTLSEVAAYCVASTTYPELSALVAMVGGWSLLIGIAVLREQSRLRHGRSSESTPLYEADNGAV